MTVASIFDFRFPKEHAEEGVDVANSVGDDMTKTEGYVAHEVVRDFSDSGHVAVVTHWHEQAQGEAVLAKYLHDEKIQKATELAGKAPSGFIGVEL